MSITAYHEKIIEARQIPFKRTQAVEQRLKTALRMAMSEIDVILRDSTRNDKLTRAIYLARRQGLQDAFGDLSLRLKKDITDALSEVSTEIAELRQKETNRLLRDAGFPLADFTEVPQLTLELLSQRIDKEGLLRSAAIWGAKQAEIIDIAIETAIARGTSARDLSRDLRLFVVGADSFEPGELADLRKVRGATERKLGTSIAGKALRLARTEINTAYWESSRFSAQESPLVVGMKWNLSNRHTVWDVCDLLSEQDVYGLGTGVYPPEFLPPKPHPNDLCWTSDVLRDLDQWDQPKPDVDIPQTTHIVVSGATGTPGHIERETKLAQRAIQIAQRGEREKITQPVFEFTPAKTHAGAVAYTKANLSDKIGFFKKSKKGLKREKA